MKKLLFLLLLTACTHHTSIDSFVASNVPRRQKQKITALQRKLENAEKQQEKIDLEVEELREDLRQAELALIRKVVENCEDRLDRFRGDPEEISALFLNERETLHRMIQSGPSPASFEAQLVLDQILRIITNVSETR